MESTSLHVNCLCDLLFILICYLLFILTGVNCELDIDECGTLPCKNGGICVNGINQFTCECQGGFTGTTCTSELFECGSSPCLNDGVCKDRLNGYECECAEGKLLQVIMT